MNARSVASIVREISRIERALKCSGPLSLPDEYKSAGLRELATKYHVGYRMIRRWLTERGVAIRQPSKQAHATRRAHVHAQ